MQEQCLKDFLAGLTTIEEAQAVGIVSADCAILIHKDDARCERKDLNCPVAA